MLHARWVIGLYADYLNPNHALKGSTKITTLLRKLIKYSIGKDDIARATLVSAISAFLKLTSAN